MFKKTIIGIFIFMALIFVGIAIKVKLYLNKLETESIESSNKYYQSMRDMDSLHNLENIRHQMRIKYIQKLESEFRKKNLHVIVTSSGNKDQILNLKCILFNETTIKENSIKNSIDTWRKLGFTKVIISDGYQNSYTLKLQ